MSCKINHAIFQSPPLAEKCNSLICLPVLASVAFLLRESGNYVISFQVSSDILRHEIKVLLQMLLLESDSPTCF